MSRNILLLITMATGLAAAVGVATAIAAGSAATQHRNITVIEKNEAYPVIGPLLVTPCKLEDCSDA